MYKQLLENGWKLNDIDNMDINYFLSLMCEDDIDKTDNIEDFYKSI